MDRVGNAEFRELLEIDAVPAVSIYMPIQREEMTDKVMRLQFRSQVDEVADRLESSEKVDPEVYEPMLTRLEEMVDEHTFWHRNGDGVAVFMAPGFERVYFLPVAFDEQNVVGTNFHTRPLLEHVAAPEDYWVLAVGEKEVSFWEGTSAGVEPVHLEDLPENLQDALMLERGKDQDGLTFQTADNYTEGKSRTDQGGERQLPSPLYHGHGGGKEKTEAYLRQYFSEVSKGIRDYLGGAEGPVILAAVDFCHPIFKRASKLDNIADEGIEGNVHYWSDQQIYDAAWPIAKREMKQRVDHALDQWERAYGRDGAENDPAQIGKLAVQGRVHKLLLDEDAESWGHYDRDTGDIEILENHDPDDREGAMAVDIYDEIAETVIELGGDVVVVPSERMPGNDGVGAILRGF